MVEKQTAIAILKIVCEMLIPLIYNTFILDILIIAQWFSTFVEKLPLRKSN